MSSIYKKSRDGYFYYQVYTFNHKTKKKDKRVYHSLNTKEIEEAKKKQRILDIKYKGENIIPSNGLFVKTIKSNQIIIITFSIILTVTGFIFLDFGHFIKYYFKNSPDLSFSKNSDFKELNILISPQKEKIDKSLDFKKNIVTKALTTPFITIDSKMKPKILKHNIIRVDVLSNAFNQGKIYVTIDEESDSEKQKILCKFLLKKYEKFTNIIICLYSNNEAGNSLANGKELNLNSSEKNKAWLAMYSYNSVEGEYFNDNPNGYLGFD